MLSKIWIAVAATLVVAGGTAAVLMRREAAQREQLATASITAPAQDDERVAREPELSAATQPLDATRAATGIADVAPVVRGVLLDQARRPIENAEIFVGGWSNPFATPGDAARDMRMEVALQVAKGRVLRGELDEIHALDPDAMRREGLMCGCVLTTDAAGAFEAKLPEAGRAWVQVIRTVGVQPIEGAGAWHETPAREIALTAQRIPTATLLVRVTDETTGEHLSKFECLIREERRSTPAREGEDPPDSVGFAAWDDGVAEIRLEIEGAPEQYEVKLVEPLWAQASEVLVVAADTRPELAFAVKSGAGLSGVVMDESGIAVEGALVFWGDLLHMRAHSSLTGAFHTECAPDPVRTDARGHFTLPGQAELVSAWHAELSPVTVPASEASSLRLSARGGLRGRAVDAQGRPVAEARVELDRERSTTTDASGAWSFDRLEAGLHGVELPLDRWVIARVPPGAMLEVDVEWIGDVTVDVLSGGAPYHEHFGGVIIGSGIVFLLREFETEQGQLGVWNALPGRYHLISRSGRIASFEVLGTTASVELGDADLTVHAAPGEHVYLLPAGADDALTFWSRRSSVETPDSGAAVWKPLARGRWQVATEERGVVGSVVVTAPGAQFTID